MSRKDFYHYNPEYSESLRKERELLRSTRIRSRKTDWVGYAQVLVVAGLVAYIIGHLVISL